MENMFPELVRPAYERALKKVVLHSKNFLFYKIQKGATTGDIYNIADRYRQQVRQ